LFEGFGEGVDEVGGEVGEFFFGLGLELGEGEGGVDDLWRMVFAEPGDVVDGGGGGAGEEGGDFVEEGLAALGAEEFEVFDGDGGIVWGVGRHGGMI
jgi:hypothetical protein